MLSPYEFEEIDKIHHNFLLKYRCDSSNGTAIFYSEAMAFALFTATPYYFNIYCSDMGEVHHLMDQP